MLRDCLKSTVTCCNPLVQLRTPRFRSVLAERARSTARAKKLNIECHVRFTAFLVGKGRHEAVALFIDVYTRGPRKYLDNEWAKLR